MSFSYIREIPGPALLKEMLPVTTSIRRLKKARDTAIKSILRGKSKKLLLVIGPCSAHDEDAVVDYTCRLAKVQQRTEDKLVLVPRIFTNKPRTTGEGYKGMLHQPDHQKSPNIVEGIKAIRRMHLRVITESGLTAADEMLYPVNHPYLEDLLSYVTVGARSVENQQHRMTASGVDIPVGMKNPTSGDMTVMLNSILAAQLPHTFAYNGWEAGTSGNPYAHAVLRGAVDHHGQNIPNYHFEDLIAVVAAYREKGLKNPAIVIDTNHANSNKRFDQQPRIALEVMQSRKYSREIESFVKGLMIESFIVAGTQKSVDNEYGKSITDPCMGWKETERLLLDIAELVD